MNKKQKNLKLIISISFFVILLLCNVIYFLYQKKDNIYDNIKEEGEATNLVNTEIDYTENKQENEQIYNNELPIYRNDYKNNNIVAKLKIPSIGLETLVTRSGNNKYYLNHDIYNNYSEIGNPFVDFRNKDLYNNMQVNIYGHNTNNSRYIDKFPFAKLDKYVDYEFYKNNKDIFLDIDEAEIHYKIIAVKIINSSDDEHMVLNYSNENDWNNHINTLLNNTLYNDQIQISSTDKLLVLQACHYNPKNTYILIICKKE